MRPVSRADRAGRLGRRGLPPLPGLLPVPAEQDGRWHVGPDETLASLLGGLQDQAARTRAILQAHDLAEAGPPGDRWDGAAPPPLERILFHLLQESARHLGHPDIVIELVTGDSGE